MKPVSTQPRHIVFQGSQANRLAAEKLMSWKGLEKVLETDDSPYLGHAPAQLLEATGYSEKKLLKKLDTLVSRFWLGYAFHNSLPFSKKLFPLKTGTRLPLGSGLQAEYFCPGGGPGYYLPNQYLYRHLLFIKAGNTRYVLKLLSSAFTEAAFGYYYTTQGTKDLSRFYVANLAKGWILMEYIDNTSQPWQERPGKTLAEQGVHFLDEFPRNRVNGIRIDHGAYVTPPESSF